MTSAELFDEICNRKYSDCGYSTPSTVVDEMLKMVPDSIWNNPRARVLDANCKSRVFLDACFKKFKAHLGLPNNYIWHNMLYAACTSKAMAYVMNYNIPELVNVEGWDSMKLSDGSFDLVVGNPPYNSDSYLDFVMKGHRLAKRCSVWITPAKWQSKEDISKTSVGRYTTFRNDFVPYIRDIYTERDSANIFVNTDIAGGISWFLMDKKRHATKKINDVFVEDWDVDYGFDLEAINIIKKVFKGQSVLDVDKYRPSYGYFCGKQFVTNPFDGHIAIEDTSSPYWLESSTKCMQVEESAFRHVEDMDKWKVYSTVHINKRCTPRLVEPNHAMYSRNVLLGYGTKGECESIASYYQCKLIWFMICVIASSVLNTYAFKFVPLPDAFDHIFTDEELYAKYGITDEDKVIIESVINSR